MERGTARLLHVLLDFALLLRGAGAVINLNVVDLFSIRSRLRKQDFQWDKVRATRGWEGEGAEQSRRTFTVLRSILSTVTQVSFRRFTAVRRHQQSSH